MATKANVDVEVKASKEANKEASKAKTESKVDYQDFVFSLRMWHHNTPTAMEYLNKKWNELKDQESGIAPEALAKHQFAYGPICGALCGFESLAAIYPMLPAEVIDCVVITANKDAKAAECGTSSVTQGLALCNGLVLQDNGVIDRVETYVLYCAMGSNGCKWQLVRYWFDSKSLKKTPRAIIVWESKEEKDPGTNQHFTKVVSITDLEAIHAKRLVLATNAEQAKLEASVWLKTNRPSSTLSERIVCYFTGPYRDRLEKMQTENPGDFCVMMKVLSNHYFPASFFAEPSTNGFWFLPTVNENQAEWKATESVNRNLLNAGLIRFAGYQKGALMWHDDAKAFLCGGIGGSSTQWSTFSGSQLNLKIGQNAMDPLRYVTEFQFELAGNGTFVQDLHVTETHQALMIMLKSGFALQLQKDKELRDILQTPIPTFHVNTSGSSSSSSEAAYCLAQAAHRLAQSAHRLASGSSSGSSGTSSSGTSSGSSGTSSGSSGTSSSGTSSGSSGTSSSGTSSGSSGTSSGSSDMYLDPSSWGISLRYPVTFEKLNRLMECVQSQTQLDSVGTDVSTDSSVLHQPCCNCAQLGAKPWYASAHSQTTSQEWAFPCLKCTQEGASPWLVPADKALQPDEHGLYLGSFIHTSHANHPQRVGIKWLDNQRLCINKGVPVTYGVPKDFFEPPSSCLTFPYCLNRRPMMCCTTSTEVDSTTYGLGTSSTTNLEYMAGAQGQDHDGEESTLLPPEKLCSDAAIIEKYPKKSVTFAVPEKPLELRPSLTEPAPKRHVSPTSSLSPAPSSLSTEPAPKCPLPAPSSQPSPPTSVSPLALPPQATRRSAQRHRKQLAHELFGANID